MSFRISDLVAYGIVEASTLKKTGGTSSQFLKADGTVDSSAYITSAALSSYLPLSGGTLTGQLAISYNNSSVGSSVAALTINNTGSQSMIYFMNSGSQRGSIRVDSTGNMILNSYSSNFYFNNDFTTGSSLSFITNSTTFMTVNTSGDITASVSMRAPIFYDSDNTSYYGNFAGTSNLYALTVNQTISGSITGTAAGETLSTVTGRGATTSSNLTLSGGNKIVIQNGTDGTSARGLFLWTSADTNWGIYMSQSGAGKSLANGTACTSIDGQVSHHIRFRVANGSDNGFIWENNAEQALMSLKPNNGNLYTRGQIYAGNSTSNLVLHTGNYNSYAPTLTGGGASGTWGISITGNANNITQYTINQNLGTGNSPTFSDVYSNNWFRNNSSNTGLYNQTTTQHWSSNTNGYWDASSTTSVSAIRFYTGGHVTSLRGYVYADTGNNIGFLNSAGNWSFRVDNSGNTFATNSSRAPIFYDSDNTAYYLDPNSNSNLNTLTLNQINYTTSYNGRYTEWYCGIGTGPASGGNRYEVARIGIDFNDWNSVGTFEVELQEVYYYAGCRKRYVISYGYGGPVIRCDLVEANGSGNFGNFRVIVGSEVVVSGDWRYIPIYVDAQSYTQVAIKVRTTRQITNSTVPEVGYAKIFTSSSASSISSFSTDSTVYLTSNQVGIAAPIFYDSDNTSYYLDPAGTSNIRKTNIVAIGQSWDDGLNLYSADATNRWNVLVDNGASDMLRFAFNNAEKFRVQTDGVVIATGDFRAPIFYDSNDTTYYADFANTGTSIFTAGIIRSSGMIMKGSSGGGQIYPTMSNGGVSLYGGNNLTNGAYFTVTGLDYPSSPGAGSAEFVIRNAASSKFALFSYNGSTWTGRYGLFGSTGNVTIGDANTDIGYRLYVIGDIYATGNIIAYSDKRVKTNIREIENPLDRVLNSRGVLYDRTDTDDKNQIGFIAQELEEQFPELVSTSTDGRKGVLYPNMVAVLLEAMKEQQKQIDKLKTLIDGTSK